MCTSIHPFDANCTSQAKIVQTERSCAYAERLCSLVPLPEAKVFYTNSGTEAVEAALKLARYVTGRPNILSFAGAFHGRTMGSLSVSTSKAAFRARHEPFLPGVLVAPYPRHELGPTLEAIDHLLAEQSLPDRIAACIVELVLGEGGYVVPPDAFLPALRRLCDEHGIVLIVDEVQSGFGRTGRLFACQHTMVSPDLMTLGKGIASGLPMGALVGRAGPAGCLGSGRPWDHLRGESRRLCRGRRHPTRARG